LRRICSRFEICFFADALGNGLGDFGGEADEVMVMITPRWPDPSVEARAFGVEIELDALERFGAGGVTGHDAGF